MSSKIKIKETIHDIKVKDSKNDFNHFIKSSMIQIKPGLTEEKLENNQSVESKSADNIKNVGVHTSYDAIYKSNKFRKESITKIKHKQESQTESKIKTKDNSKVNPIESEGLIQRKGNQSYSAELKRCAVLNLCLYHRIMQTPE